MFFWWGRIDVGLEVKCTSIDGILLVDLLIIFMSTSYDYISVFC